MTINVHIYCCASAIANKFALLSVSAYIWPEGHIIYIIMENGKHVFISYSSINKAVADAICHELEEYGIACWIAPRDITPGKTWAGNIVQAIRDSSLMVLVYSADSNRSSQVANEVDKAFSYNKTIIPFMVDDTPMNDEFDYYLSRKHWLIAYPDYKEKLLPLVESVATILGVEIRKKEKPAEAGAVSGPEKPAVNPRFEMSIENGRQALMDYDMETAFVELLSPALENYGEARNLMNMVVKYRQRIVKVNKMLFRRVKNFADEGNSYAQYLMARYYICIEPNDRQAFGYLEKSAEQNDVLGIIGLSTFYAIGSEDCAVDPDKSYSLLNKALASGNAWAMLQMAKEMLFAWTFRKNVNRGIMLLKKCMDAGIPESFDIMADLYKDGTGVEKNQDKALEYYNKAIERGYYESYESLGFMYILDPEDSQQLNTEENQKKAISYFRKGVDLEVPGCLSALAMCYREGYGVPVKEEQSLIWYKKAAGLGDRFSCYQVGYMLYYGKGCNKDDIQAWEWLSKGKEMGDSACNYMLGIMCLDGAARQGKSQKDCIGYFELSAHLGGYAGSMSAMKLYDIFRTRSLENDAVFEDLEDTYIEYDWAEKDDAKALKFLKRAVEQGDDGLSAFKYGAILCQDNTGISDPLEGMKYLKEASEKNEPHACVKLGQLYHGSDWVENDDSLAEGYFDKGICRDYGGAYLEKGLLQARQAAKMISDNMPAEQISPLAGAAMENIRKSEEKSCCLWDIDFTVVGYNIDEYITDEDRSLFFASISRHASRGCLQAILDKGVCMAIGLYGKEKDMKEAARYYEEAAGYGSDVAAKNLADLYSEAEPGFKTDLPAAAYWYSRCQDRDGVKAKLSELNAGGRDFCLQYENGYTGHAGHEYLDWIFPQGCDIRFQCGSIGGLAVFSLAPSGWSSSWSGEGTDGLPSLLGEIYNEIQTLKSLSGSPYLKSDIPVLEKNDIFPYLKLSKFRELQEFCVNTWLEIKRRRSSDPILSKYRNDIENNTFMLQDMNSLLDLGEKLLDSSSELTTIIVSICNISWTLSEEIWKEYAPLYMMNRLIDKKGDDPIRAPREYLIRIAGIFDSGTEVIPRNPEIARIIRTEYF